MRTVSVIISSYNQKNRLEYCLDSACNLKHEFADNIEIIVADDHSTDGSIDLIKNYPVKLSLNHSKNDGKYTLAENWNHAVHTHATGERVVFTNGDHILTPRFADHHMDPVMEDNIVFGPGYQTAPGVVEYINQDTYNYIDLLKICEQNDLLLPDRRCAHQTGAASTYNKEFTSEYPYGYNFSVNREHFVSVGGFDPIRSWGGEEQTLCDKITNKHKHVKIVSNCNSVVVHLYHTPHNLINRQTGVLAEYAD